MEKLWQASKTARKTLLKTVAIGSQVLNRVNIVSIGKRN